MRGIVAFGFVLAALTTLAAQSPSQPFTSGTALVVVPAVVVDRKEQPVTDLTAADFEVYEDGQPVEVATFVAANPAAGERDRSASGRFIVLLLDDLRVEPTLVWRVKELAANFIGRIGPRDTVTVIRLSGDSGVTSSEPGPLLATLNKYASFGSEMSPHPFARDAQHAMQTIGDLARQMRESPHPRKVLVCIGTSALFNPTISSEPMPGAGTGRGTSVYSAFWFAALRDTARYNTSVYAIDPTGMAARVGADGVGSFTTATGGDALTRSNGFAAFIDRIWRESATYYLLGYRPPVSDDNRLHRIEVKVKRPDLRIRHRRARG